MPGGGGGSRSKTHARTHVKVCPISRDMYVSTYVRKMEKKGSFVFARIVVERPFAGSADRCVPRFLT